MLKSVLAGLGESSDIRDVVDSKLKVEFDLQKFIACGGEGCVYLTGHGTAVKIYPDCAAVEGPIGEIYIAHYLQTLYGKHPCIPLIHRVGRVKNRQCCFASFVEREPMNSVIIDDESLRPFFTYGTPIFSDLTAAQLPPRIWETREQLAMDLPEPARGYALQMLEGIRWLRKRFIRPGDLEKLSNWGLRADGTLAVRDFGGLMLFAHAPESLHRFNPWVDDGEYDSDELLRRYAIIKPVNPGLKTVCDSD